MSQDLEAVWTEADFEKMSWHDNYVHGFALVEGDHGTGDLQLDIDHILEWLKGDLGGFKFKIAPATLIFREVFGLTISLDYSSCAMGPFSIDGIKRRLEKRERYTATLWTIKVNFPNGEISFESSGFTQRQRLNSLIVDRQWLTASERTTDA